MCNILQIIIFTITNTNPGTIAATTTTTTATLTTTTTTTTTTTIPQCRLGALTFRSPCIVSVFLLLYFRDATLHILFISGKLLYMFRVVSSPITRSTYNCIYSIWYFLTINVICLYCGRVGVGLSVVWELY